jgi:Raf kinase inhibitor-like YbhB/YbcL family protein
MRAVIAFCLILTACGGSADEPATTTTATPATTAPPTTVPETAMQLTSPAFEHEGSIPRQFTCNGAEVSPPLAITGLPAGTTHLVVVMDDPDAPGGTWDHWVVYDVPVTDTLPSGDGVIGTVGISTGGVAGYESPCPPSGSHRYVFTVTALDRPLGLAAGATKAAVLEAVAAAGTHALATATLLGRYSRS